MDARRYATRTLATVGAVLVLIACALPSTRRIHAENMRKAETFKVEFDRANPVGTYVDDVNHWLQSRDLHLTSSMNEFGGGDVLLELFTENSPLWYCGKGFVGLEIRFESRKVVQTRTSSGSFDCP